MSVNELVFLGLVAMVAPVFAKYAGYEHEGHLDWIGVGGLFFLLAAATTIPLFSIRDVFMTFGHYMGILSQGMGFLFLVIGTLLGVIDVLRRTPVHVRIR